MHKPPRHRFVLAENSAPTSCTRVGLSDASGNEKTLKLYRFLWNIHHNIFPCVSVLVKPSPFSPLHRQSFLLLLPWPASFLLCGFHSNGNPCPWLSIPNQSRSCERRLQSFSTSLFTTSSFLFFSPSSRLFYLSPFLILCHFYLCFFFSRLSFFCSICLSLLQSCWCKVTVSIL